MPCAAPADLDTTACADGLLHESCIQKFPVHTEMEKIWPSEGDCPKFK